LLLGLFLLDREVGIDQRRCVLLRTWHQVSVGVKVIRMLPWPMNAHSAFAFTPAAIVKLAAM
jgi:hypothetical protein